MPCLYSLSSILYLDKRGWPAWLPPVAEFVASRSKAGVFDTVFKNLVVVEEGLGFPEGAVRALQRESQITN